MCGRHFINQGRCSTPRCRCGLVRFYYISFLWGRKCHHVHSAWKHHHCSSLLVSLVQCAKLVCSQAMGGSLGSASVPTAAPVKESSMSGGFFKALAGATVGRGKDKDKDKNRAAALTAGVATHPDSNSSSSHISRPLTQSTNIFSLVERFTFRPSPNETHLPSPPSFPATPSSA